MEKIAYYQELYKLQDRVLAIIFDISNEFYLTGGTCISRYYQPKRYRAPLKTVNCAKEKMRLNIEDLIIRLKTFPKKWLNEINLIDREFLKEFELKKIINKIREQNNGTN